MEKKIYHLSTCSTCQRILKDIRAEKNGFTLQDIKSEAITKDQLDQLKKAAGTYEALFSRRAMKFRQSGLHEKTLSEDDYKALVLNEYTFLKRPVIVIGEQVFVGNAKKTIEQVKKALPEYV